MQHFQKLSLVKLRKRLLKRPRAYFSMTIQRRWNFLLQLMLLVQTQHGLVEFVAASLVGMGATLACLGVSHYWLGLTTLLEDNISANVVGLLLGTMVRFVLYRYWVWNPGNRGATGVSIND